MQLLRFIKEWVVYRSSKTEFNTFGEWLIARKLKNSSLAEPVACVSIIIGDGDHVHTSVLQLDSTKPLGQVLTEAVDNRKEKSMYLLDYSVIRS